MITERKEQATSQLEHLPRTYSLSKTFIRLPKQVPFPLPYAGWPRPNYESSVPLTSGCGPRRSSICPGGPNEKSLLSFIKAPNHRSICCRAPPSGVAASQEPLPSSADLDPDFPPSRIRRVKLLVPSTQ